MLLIENQSNEILQWLAFGTTGDFPGQVLQTLRPVPRIYRHLSCRYTFLFSIVGFMIQALQHDLITRRIAAARGSKPKEIIRMPWTSKASLTQNTFPYRVGAAEPMSPCFLLEL